MKQITYQLTSQKWLPSPFNVIYMVTKPFVYAGVIRRMDTVYLSGLRETMSDIQRIIRERVENEPDDRTSFTREKNL